MKVLVSGDRHYTDSDNIGKVLKTLVGDSYPWSKSQHDEIQIVIIHGSKGAGRLAGKWAIELKYRNVEVSTDRKVHGKEYGSILNQKILVEHQPELVLAFHSKLNKSRGTKDLVRQCLKLCPGTAIYNIWGKVELNQWILVRVEP